MPSLHWIGKDKVVNHHMDVPFKVLEHAYGFSNGKQSDDETKSGNKIIHGDNLEALKALLPEYEGRIKCIYIDPPYNTGNENWVYNDNVNDPKIKKWLYSVVGKEGDDLSRHDKWLCMMYPRLTLLRKLLNEDGVIFISIDDNELANLKLLCDEILGTGNFVANIIWRGGKRNAAKYISNSHEYILFYAKNLKKIDESGTSWKVKKNGIDDIYKKYKELLKKYKNDYENISKDLKEWFRNLPESNPAKDHKHYSNVDKTGIYCSDNISRVGGGKYEVTSPLTGNKISAPSRGWVWGKEEDFWRAYKNDIIIFSPDDNLPILKRYLVDNEFQILDTVFYKDRRAASKALGDLLGKNIFEFPKDVDVINYFINAVSEKEALILDSFAGSGTTGQAVLNLNKQDGGNRKFILIEMEDYAETITSERVKRVINGYSETEGTGGSFDYYELGQSLFLEDGNLNELVGIEKIRQYVFYTETKTPLTKTKYKDNEYFLDKHNDTCYYFHYEQDEVTTLNHAFLATMKTKAEQYVIYADNCLLTKDFITKHHIIFKKIPRDITKF